MSHSFADDSVRQRLAEYRDRLRANPHPDDAPTVGAVTVERLLGQFTVGSPLCRCLVCGNCDSRRTIEHPVVCDQCAAGSHLPPAFRGGLRNGGLL